MVGAMRNKAMTGTVKATIGPVMASWRLAAVLSTSSRRWPRISPARSMSADRQVDAPRGRLPDQPVGTSGRRFDRFDAG